MRTCSKLGPEIHSPYEKELVNLSKISEQDQIEYVEMSELEVFHEFHLNDPWCYVYVHGCRCHKAIVLSQTRSSVPEDLSQVSLLLTNLSHVLDFASERST